MKPPEFVSRRSVMLALSSVAAPMAWAQTSSPSSTATSEESLEQAVLRFTGGVQPQQARVSVTIAALVDNGNAVPVEVVVDSPQQPDSFVSQIAIFNEKNPQREVVEFELGPASGRAQVATRIRLATTQNIAAVAKLSDGSYWMRSVNVIVTLAACIEGEEGS